MNLLTLLGPSSNNYYQIKMVKYQKKFGTKCTREARSFAVPA